MTNSSERRIGTKLTYNTDQITDKVAFKTTPLNAQKGFDPAIDLLAIPRRQACFKIALMCTIQKFKRRQALKYGPAKFNYFPSRLLCNYFSAHRNYVNMLYFLWFPSSQLTLCHFLVLLKLILFSPFYAVPVLSPITPTSTYEPIIS